MHWHLIGFGIYPIIAFFIMERLGRPRSGIVAAVIVAAVLWAYNSSLFAGTDFLSLLSLGLFIVLGTLSLVRHRLLYFKLQPVVLELILAVTFLYASLIKGQHLLWILAKDYLGLYKILPVYQHGYWDLYLQSLSHSLPLLLIFHAGLTAYAAVKLSTAWWFSIRVLIYYILIALLFFGERLIGVGY